MSHRTRHSASKIPTGLTRRRFLRGTGALGALAGLSRLAPTYAWAETLSRGSEPGVLSGPEIDLSVRRVHLPIAGGEAVATTVNGSVPGPLLRLREGEEVTIRVTNLLEEDTSIHWHGVLVPAPMDGVPGVSFPGIHPGETFVYRFPLKQSGTYWYHSHSDLQEQLGHYAPMVIDPAGPDPVEYDRDYVVLLSDWSFADPDDLLSKLKNESHFDNFQRITVRSLLHRHSSEELDEAVRRKLAWDAMRMLPTDLADITGHSYTYLMNGLGPQHNWTGLFRPGERVRLRCINGSAMSIFDLRIPGLAITVVQADGQDVEPVEVDELRIGTAETYDVIVEPREERAFTVFAESIDRSGYARGTLAPRRGMEAPIPELRPQPLRGMESMGMFGHGEGMEMDHGRGMEMDHETTAMPSGGGEHDAHSMAHAGSNQHTGAALHAGVVPHPRDHHGPGNSHAPEATRSRLDEPGIGLGHDSRRVLCYTDLRAREPFYDLRTPSREIELHLTGNMHRYMWSFDGKKFSHVDGPIHLRYGERVRITLVNDTMMEHPIHLHGMWSVLENGQGDRCPRKHTVLVKPAERLSFLLSADAPGKWAFHCHLLYHMMAGMFRVVRVSQPESLEESS